MGDGIDRTISSIRASPIMRRMRLAHSPSGRPRLGWPPVHLRLSTKSPPLFTVKRCTNNWLTSDVRVRKHLGNLRGANDLARRIRKRHPDLKLEIGSTTVESQIAGLKPLWLRLHASHMCASLWKRSPQIKSQQTVLDSPGSLRDVMALDKHASRHSPSRANDGFKPI